MNKNEAFHSGTNTMTYSRQALNALANSGNGKPRTHYEFWGNLVSSYNLTRAIIAFLAVLIVLLCAMLYMVASKPSLVFKVDHEGRASSYKPSSGTEAFDEELNYMTSEFIRSHCDLNPFSIEGSLNKALDMCSDEVRKNLMSEIKNDKLVETSRKYNPTVNLEMGTISIKKKEPPYYETFCIVNINFIKPKTFLRVHTYDILWKKGNRTNENPTGLYIVKLDHYDQGDINKPIN